MWVFEFFYYCLAVQGTIPKLASCGNFQVLRQLVVTWGLGGNWSRSQGRGRGDFARPQGCSFPPGRRPGLAGPSPPRLGLRGGHLRQKWRPVNSWGGCCPLREETRELSTYCLKKKVLHCPEDEAVRCPCGIREPAGRSPFVPSDRGSLAGGRAPAEP